MEEKLSRVSRHTSQAHGGAGKEGPDCGVQIVILLAKIGRRVFGEFVGGTQNGYGSRQPVSLVAHLINQWLRPTQLDWGIARRPCLGGNGTHRTTRWCRRVW